MYYSRSDRIIGNKMAAAQWLLQYDTANIPHVDHDTCPGTISGQYQFDNQKCLACRVS